MLSRVAERLYEDGLIIHCDNAVLLLLDVGERALCVLVLPAQIGVVVQEIVLLLLECGFFFRQFLQLQLRSSQGFLLLRDRLLFLLL